MFVGWGEGLTCLKVIYSYQYIVNCIARAATNKLSTAINNYNSSGTIATRKIELKQRRD
jgi:hypothetical protein